MPEIELHDLREEFVRQVLELRERIFCRVQPKALNGRQLSGDMLADLALSYIEAIN